MLEYIHIKYVKGIKDHKLELKVPPNKPILIVAPNGFGKSSIARGFSSLQQNRINLNKDSDKHQESDNYDPSIEIMLDKAETKRNQWLMVFERARTNQNRKQMLLAAKNSKALEGVIKTLRWTLGDKDVEHPLE